MKKRELPEWAKEAKKAMIDKSLNVSELADKIGLTRPHVSAVLNGRLLSPNAQEAICNFLEVEIPRDNTLSQ